MRILTKKMQLPLDNMITIAEAGKDFLKVIKKFAKMQDVDKDEIKSFMKSLKKYNTDKVIATLFENAFDSFTDTDINYYLEVIRKIIFCN
jgi:hypothetical protein